MTRIIATQVLLLQVTAQVRGKAEVTEAPQRRLKLRERLIGVG